MENYGVDNPFKSEVFQQKGRDTMMKNYGVKYSMQNEELREKQVKSAMKNKTYTFSSGKEIQCQGYEPWALNILVEKYGENDILCDNDMAKSDLIPQFWYEYDGSKHRYYPDICIISEKKIIEVKSTHTAKIEPEIIELKMESVLNAKYEIELWIFDEKGQLIS